MARALIVGCGCRGRELGAALIREGWSVRGTTRDPRGFDEIEGAGIEPAIADPDRPGTIVELMGDVTVIVWLLGSASGSEDELSAIHGPRLERLLEKVVDSPVRGFVYESQGSVPDDLLERGRAALEDATERWQIPVAYLDSAQAESRQEWVEAARGAVFAAIG